MSRAPEAVAAFLGGRRFAVAGVSRQTAQALRYEHLDVRMLGPESALATGQYILSGNGLPDRTGWFTTVWAHTTAGWRMIHDHS
jgi:hypothetical protein